MKESIYEIAKKCRCVSEGKMEIDRTLIPSRNFLFTDYTVKGAIDDYLLAIDALCTAIAEKYPLLSSDLKQHKDRFGSVALDRLERELTSFYDSPHRGEARSRQRQSSLDHLAMK